MKFFSLISNKEVHLADDQKIIPAEDFSSIIEAKQLLDETKKEIEKYKEKINKECEQLKNDEKEKGFNEGLSQFNEKILELDKQFNIFKEDMEKKILPLTLQAAKKILGDELKTNPERIVDIVKQSIKPVMQHKKIIIYVNKEDLQYLEEKKDEILQKLAQVESFSLQERPDIKKGGCIIQTESGIINAQLENQWNALEAAFKKIMKK